MKPQRVTTAASVCRRVLIALLTAALLTWAAAAPLVWILRDGLGPDMIESGWGLSIVKFLVQWGTPALILALPLIALMFFERRSAAKRTQVL